MESKNIILGREGHIDQTFVFGDLSNTRENADLAKNASLDTSFTEGYTYKDYKSGDKIAAAGIGALVATSLGVKALKSSGGAAAAGGILLLLKKFWWILLAPLAFICSRCLDYPYNGWHIRCVAPEKAILDIRTRRIDIRFEIVKGFVYLR